MVREFYENGKIVAAACHGTAALLNTRLSDGKYLQQDSVMPLLLQESFGERGASYVEAAPWTPNVVVDGRLISGQNPPSAEGVGEQLIKLLAADL
jgi:putative intracellular protease/amidase